MLLDANVVVVLVVADHVHHEPAEVWFADEAGGFATCPITEAPPVGLLVRESQSASAVTGLLAALRDDPRRVFWADALNTRLPETSSV